MDSLKQWYAGLEEREQKIVLVFSVVIASCLLIFGIVKPINDKVSNLQKDVGRLQGSISSWQQDLPRLMGSGAQTRGGSNQPLSAIVTSSTRDFNLRVSRVQEKGSDEFQVWFDNVAFNDFIRWITVLNNRYQVSVVSVNVRSKDRDGLSGIDVKLHK